ncbi:hypothetical protein B0H12DRAFT_1080264 [Mycena haematopus]|nr:hypothetical protein B0H12DRAFT_1080264 [Mycena haematopus]
MRMELYKEYISLVESYPHTFGKSVTNFIVPAMPVLSVASRIPWYHTFRVCMFPQFLTTLAGSQKCPWGESLHPSDIQRKDEDKSSGKDILVEDVSKKGEVLPGTGHFNSSRHQFRDGAHTETLKPVYCEFIVPSVPETIAKATAAPKASFAMFPRFQTS